MISFGQASQLGRVPDWQKKVYRVLIKEEKSSYVLKDSIAMYAFNFKLKIVKSKGHGTTLKHLFVSDTLMHKLFPNYKEFYNIDFSALLRKRKEVNVVIPILVYSVSPSGRSRYPRHDGDPLLSIESAMEISEKSLVSIAPKNSFEEVVLLEPVVIKIINLVN